MFSIRAIWQHTPPARNLNRVSSTVHALNEAASLYEQAAKALREAAHDLDVNVKPVATRPGFGIGEVQNVAQFVGSKVADGARKAWQASETATEAVVYAGGLEVVADEPGE